MYELEKEKEGQKGKRYGITERNLGEHCLKLGKEGSDEFIVKILPRPPFESTVFIKCLCQNLYKTSYDQCTIFRFSVP